MSFTIKNYLTVLTTALINSRPIQIIGDLYWNNVAVLLKGEGTNSGSNNVFIDSSSNNYTVTRGGLVTQGNISPFSGSGGSAYFNGSCGWR